MKNLKKIILKEVNRYEKLQEKLSQENIINNNKLHIAKDKDFTKYYIVEKSNGKKKYIYVKKEDLSVVKEIIYTDYKKKLSKLLKKRIGQFNRILSDYSPNEIDDIYNNLSQERKNLIQPVEPIYSEILTNKKEHSASKNTSFTENLNYKTKKGEFVRSKSEKIIADYFYDKNIEYFYEYPLKLGPRTIFPDFTIIHPITKEEIYWEHFGRFDDPNYVSKSLRKISDYRESGIFLDDRLIITFEDKANFLNLNHIELLVKRCLFS